MKLPGKTKKLWIHHTLNVDVTNDGTEPWGNLLLQLEEARQIVPPTAQLKFADSTRIVLYWSTEAQSN